MDEAITMYVKREHDLLIGERTAERIKIELGSAYPLMKRKEMEVKGRHVLEGKPTTVVLNDNQIREALAEPVRLMIQAVRDALENGRGFALLRGFPVDRYSAEELKNLYWGVGAHLGSARYQNAQGELIGEVRDEYRLYGEVQEAPADGTLGRSSRSKARSSGPLRFHTDRCDVVTLLCVRQARAGGLSKIVSAVSVAKAIRDRRPDLHALLCQDYWRSRQGEELGGERQVYALPLFATHAGKFTTQYSRTFVEAAQKLPDVPPLTAAQNEALDLHAVVCEELAFTMELGPGDLQLLNNHIIYHGRTAYEDENAPDRDRLLLRLWLAPPNSRELPAGFEVLWGTTAAGAPRGGIAQPTC